MVRQVTAPGKEAVKMLRRDDVNACTRTGQRSKPRRIQRQCHTAFAATFQQCAMRERPAVLRRRGSRYSTRP